MSKSRTRTFKGIYTSHDNKKHPFNVRVSERLAHFGLALSLVKESTYLSVVTNVQKEVAKTM